MIPVSIGEVLVQRNVLTSQQLEEAYKAAQAEGLSLAAYLIKQERITPDQLAEYVAEAYKLPLIRKIEEKMVPPELLSRVPLRFLREYTLVPIMHQDVITIVTTDPTIYAPLDELQQIFPGSQLAVATQTTVVDALNRYYPLEGTKRAIEELEEEGDITAPVDFTAISEEDILGAAQEAPIIKLVNNILYQAVKRDASDIHIEPFEKEVRVRYRIDGVLYNVMTPPHRIQGALISRIKIMSQLNIAEKRQPQDGRIQIKIANKPIDIRVSILPVAHGERVVMRLLDKTKTFATLEKLGMSERDYRVLESSIEQPNGIILITGPTGSGKTSTLYSILNQLNRPEVNIITVEDPVEYQVSGISQVQVREKIGLTFAAALRSILRQDPDIVMIGETRDQETAQIAIQASLTGHLVLSTLHTNSASATITRLIDMGVEPFLIASTLSSVTAQRLVRRLCDACKKQYTPTEADLQRVGMSVKDVAQGTFYQPVGCSECMNTGYRGRIAIFEVMRMSPAIARLTMERADTKRIEEVARKEGMTLLLHDGMQKVMRGLTTIDEVLTAASAFDALDEL